MLFHAFIGHSPIFPVPDVGGVLRGSDALPGLHGFQQHRRVFFILLQVLCNEADGHGVAVHIVHQRLDLDTFVFGIVQLVIPVEDLPQSIHLMDGPDCPLRIIVIRNIQSRSDKKLAVDVQ